MITTETMKKRRDGDPKLQTWSSSSVLQPSSSVHPSSILQPKYLSMLRFQHLSKENILINADIKYQALFHALAMAPNISDRNGFWAGRSLTKQEC